VLLSLAGLLMVVLGGFAIIRSAQKAGTGSWQGDGPELDPRHRPRPSPGFAPAPGVGRVPSRAVDPSTSGRRGRQYRHHGRGGPLAGGATAVGTDRVGPLGPHEGARDRGGDGPTPARPLGMTGSGS
jgi:hypothetical protein